MGLRGRDRSQIWHGRHFFAGLLVGAREFTLRQIQFSALNLRALDFGFHQALHALQLVGPGEAHEFLEVTSGDLDDSQVNEPESLFQSGFGDPQSGDEVGACFETGIRKNFL